MEKTDARALILERAAAAETGQHAVIATDAEGIILYWNATASEVYGWPSVEVIGQNIEAVTPTQSSSEEAARIMERLRAGRTWTGSFLVRRRDGTPMVAEVVDTPVMMDGVVVGIIGVSKAWRRPTR